MLSSPYTHVLHKEEMSSSLIYDTLKHESIYRRDVKLPLHIGNTYQEILKQNFFLIILKTKFHKTKHNFEIPLVYKQNFNISLINKHNFKISLVGYSYL